MTIYTTFCDNTYHHFILCELNLETEKKILGLLVGYFEKVNYTK